MTNLEAESGDLRPVKTAFFGEVETDGVALAVMDGGTHGVQGHTIVVRKDGTATWGRRLDGLRPEGRAGHGSLGLADDERAKIDAWSRAAWDTAGPSGRRSFFGDPSQGPPRWVWAVVVRRGDEARLVEGGSLPAPARPLMEWLVDRVDEASREAVGNETTSAGQPVDEHRSVNGRFQLLILNESSERLRLDYDLQPAWTLLRQAHPSRIAFTITESEVETYEWSQQLITLQPGPSEELMARLAGYDEGRRHPLEGLGLRRFVVVLDGSPLYGGIFMHPVSAMGIGFPVIYPDMANARLTFLLRPIHEVTGDYASYEPQWHGIKDPRIRDLFAEAGRLLP